MRLGVMVALFLVGSPPLSAQDSVPLGQRVRITHDCRTRTPVTRQVATMCRRQAGTLENVAADSVALRVDGRVTRYRLGGITRLEVSRGRRSRWLVGGLVGSAVGGVGAFAILNGGGSTSLCDQSRNQDAVGFGECLGLATLFGALPGFGLGALVGTVARGERWEEVSTDRLRLGVAPTRHSGFRFALRIEH